MQHACQLCHNGGSHGWAWQRIVKVIEKESLRILGMEIDLPRLEGSRNDLRSCSIVDTCISRFV